MKYAIRLEDVTKRNEGITIVDQMNLTIEEGAVIGIIGSTYDKASTFMQLLTGEITPCEGKIYYGEEHLGLYGQVPEQVGVYISDIGFIPEYTGFRNLKYIAGMNGKIEEEEICKAMNFVGISPTNIRKLSRYSPRMRQKLCIAQAIMEGQNILILDAGLFTMKNKENHLEVRKILVKLKKQGFTIVLASEREEYIDRICDRCVYID